jgi:hypothetical protein
METEMHTAPTGAPNTVPGGPHLNALKHGLRSAAILLPGDDAAAFHALRRELFHTYQPCTRDEADCVEGMAGYKWRIARCHRMQATYGAALAALLAGAPAGHICEPDPHRWQHRSMDCVLEEMRLHRLMSKDRATLFQLQSMRRNRLIDGALGAPASYLTFLGEDEEPANSAEPDAPAAGRLREAPGAPHATPSNDGSIGDIRKRPPLPAAGMLRGRSGNGSGAASHPSVRQSQIRAVHEH